MSLSDLTVWSVSRFTLQGFTLPRFAPPRFALPLLVIAAALLAPDHVRAEEASDEPSKTAAEQSAAESEKFAARGFEAYKAGNFETALQFYNQALDVHPAAALYFNVARIYETKLSEPEKALIYYRKTLEASDVTAALVEKSLARIRALTALREHEDPPTEQTPPPEESSAQESEPPQSESAPRAATGEDSARSQRSTQKTIGYAVGITGLVAVGASLGLGGVALLERNQARETCDGNQCTTQGGVDSMTTAHNLATASTITLAAGSALTVIGFGMVLFAPSKSSEQESAKSRTGAGRPGVALALTPSPGGAGLQLAGAFF